MKLPGQMKSASHLLMAAIQKVQGQIGRSIEIYDITTHPDPTVRHARGHHDWDIERERIWLNPNLSYDVQEAVAAHELAHVLQKAEGYCQAASRRDAKGEPILREMGLLAQRINSLIMDVMADRWATQRGFKIDHELKSNALPKALNDVKKKKLGERESVDWQRYYSTLKELAQDIAFGKPMPAPSILPPEVRTQIRAVHYANLKLRLSPLNLFSELDTLWAEYWPEARGLGIGIAEFVETIGLENREQCERSTIAIIRHLNIPPELLVVKRPDIGQIVWPR